jgi:DNA-binding MarR family transcriptional regulator
VKGEALTTLITQTHRAVYRAREIELLSVGLSVEAADAISQIKNLGGPSTSELARALVREPQSISGLIYRLEKTGLVKRVRVNKGMQKNQVSIQLTKKGEEMHERIASTTVATEIGAVISEKEAQALELYLTKIKKAALVKMSDLGSLPLSE